MLEEKQVTVGKQKHTFTPGTLITLDKLVARKNTKKQFHYLCWIGHELDAVEPQKYPQKKRHFTVYIGKEPAPVKVISP